VRDDTLKIESIAKVAMWEGNLSKFYPLGLKVFARRVANGMHLTVHIVGKDGDVLASTKPLAWDGQDYCEFTFTDVMDAFNITIR
jgi:hypothetical protein